MSLRFKMDTQQLEKELNAARKTVQTGTLRAATEAARQSQIAMTGYLVAFIYSQPAGLYERTELALNSLGMTLSPTPNGYLLTLSSDAPYASAIEQGNELSYFDQTSSNSHVPMISGDELALLLQNVAEDNGGDPAPKAIFERRGAVNYQQPAPHVTPAAVKGMYVFMRGLEQVWKQAGAT